MSEKMVKPPKGRVVSGSEAKGSVLMWIFSTMIPFQYGGDDYPEY
jgi:hypothetical protein